MKYSQNPNCFDMITGRKLGSKIVEVLISRIKACNCNVPTPEAFIDLFISYGRGAVNFLYFYDFPPETSPKVQKNNNKSLEHNTTT